ncbi:MAG: Maf family nucleotide pyrophosphatase [Gammaproteobacteria bacterium]|nr:Maf family nucleotide pyrophosphatase [Gammaproteobacteria bacterium]
MQEPQIILASASPRRKKLLEQIGVSCLVAPVHINEIPGSAELAENFVVRMALEKASAGQAVNETNLPVLGSDTIVQINKQILGKPDNKQHALDMLMALSGHSHQVLTAVAIVNDVKQQYLLNVTDVYFRKLKEKEILAYWETREPVDKAGAYGIQGRAAQFIERIDGSYSGVMGLPLFETAQLLKEFGVVSI